MEKTTQAATLAAGVALAAVFALYRWISTPSISSLPHSFSIRPTRLRTDIVDGIEGLIGNTPLVRIRSLSEATGCVILAKAEFLNPGGSVKDRVALAMIKEAMASGQLRPGGMITEVNIGRISS